jgi:aminoglycoside 2'-N-acetyltransferase I
VSGPAVRRFATAEASAEVLTEIRELLDRVFDDFEAEDWEHTVGGVHVVVEDRGVVVAHASVVPRLLEVAGRPLRTGYVEGVGTAPERQRQGLGTAAMMEVGQIVRDTYEMGALGTGEHLFYERLGWERWRGPTYARRSKELIRTAADDDGVMVLRFGPSADVDLTAPISCEARSGDDW